MGTDFERRASPAIFALNGPKPRLKSLTSSRTRPYRKALPASRTGRPGGIESPQEGLRRLLPEPTPSPRLWATAPGATPARLCEHTMGSQTGAPKPELSTLAESGTFYFGPTDKLKGELPEWAHQYRFPEEVGILATKQKLWEEISQIEVQVSRFERLKRVLVLQGEPLVEAVMEVFDVALPLKARREEAFREDFMLIDSSGDPAALAEVKGVSKGVAREHVNQADTHRERYEMSAEFPSLLIINTNMKHSTALADKDQPVAPEQIRYAALHNVLVLRTLDLLNLASLHLSKKLNSEAVVELLTKSRGWLRVVGDTPEVLSN